MKYTEEQFRQAVRESISIAGVLRRIGLREAGGNYATARQLIKRLGLDISHFKGQAHSKGKYLGPRRDITYYFQDDIRVASDNFRKRLLREQLFEHKCGLCQLTTWNNLPIPLELHHKDGNNRNNLLENLQLLCPNCHAQTDNYRGKNKQQRDVVEQHTRNS